MKKVEKRTYYLIPISEEFDFETLKNAGICLEYPNCADAVAAENRIFKETTYGKVHIPDGMGQGKYFEVFLVPLFIDYDWHGYKGACKLVSETFFQGDSKW